MPEPKDTQLEESIRDLLIELCAVMFRYGYQEISVTKMLMLLGVPEERARTHEHEVFAFDDSFAQMWQNHIACNQDVGPRGNVTIH